MQQEDVLNLMRRAGRALHGARWQAPLARDLGVTDRALRYWLNKTNAAPADQILPKLLDILLAHKILLDDVVIDVRAAMRTK